jgi:rod shape-determining protein MreD
MRWVRFSALVLAVALLQASLLGGIAVTRFNVKPNLLIVLLVFFAVYFSTTEAIVSSFVLGFTADIIIAGAPMGPQIISFGICGTLLAYVRRVIIVRKMPYQSAVIFATAVAAGTLAYLLNLLKAPTASSNIYVVLFGVPLYSAIVGPFLFLPCAWWMRIRIDRFGRH